MIQDRTSVFPKAFTELTFGLSDVLKVAPYVYKIFGLARYGVGDFSSFVGCKKSIVCLTLSKKRTVRQRGRLHFLIPGRKNFRAAVSNGLADHAGLRYVCKL